MTAQIEQRKLANLVDMALGTPELGAVNFGVLHTVLHAMLTKLNLSDCLAEAEAATLTKGAAQQQPEEVIPLRPQTTSHIVIDRVNILEQQMSALNSLPSNKEIIDQIFSGKKTKERPVADMWQLSTLKKRTDANEDGITKISNLIDDLMRELAKLKEENAVMKDKISVLEDRCQALDKIPLMEQAIEDLRKQVEKMQHYLAKIPPPEDFVKFVTWSGLEHALKGDTDALALHLEEQSQQTSTTSATDVNKDLDVYLSKDKSEPQKTKADISALYPVIGPSIQVQSNLEELGNIYKMHRELEERVRILEELIKTKASYEDLEKVKVPQELLDLIDQMKMDLDGLMEARNKDNEAMQRLRDAFNRLQNEIDKLTNLMDGVLNKNEDFLGMITELFQITTDHEGRKADVNYVDQQVEPKADKEDMNQKVNFSLFEETTGNLNTMLEDMLKKLTLNEEEIRKLLEELSEDVDQKLNRSEMDRLKEWLDKRLRAMANKIKAPSGLTNLTEDEAAGLRKQLLQHFHCISCDRPLDVAPLNAPINNLPEKQALPANKTLRPYTTFELDSIRQHARNVAGDIVDIYQLPRSCGGAHTVTHPTKRVAKMTNINNSSIDEENEGPRLPARPQHSVNRGPAPADELDLQGLDGHIYKGRDARLVGMLQTGGHIPDITDKLPPVSTQGGLVSQPTERPHSGKTPRMPSRNSHHLLGREVGVENDDDEDYAMGRGEILVLPHTQNEEEDDIEEVPNEEAATV